MRRITAIIGLMFLTATLSWAGVGTAGGNFLLLGGGARGLAMGEAYVALAAGSSAVFWNPAGLSKTPFTQLGYMYNQWFVDIKHQYIDLAYPTENGTFGGSYSILDSGDIQGYDSSGAQTTTIKATDTGLAFAWGRKVNDRLALGIGVKNFTETLENNSAVSTALDFGLLFNINPRVRLGLALQNIGGALKFISEETPLPQTTRIGLGFNNRIFENKLTLGIDYVSSAGSVASLNYGLEYLMMDLLALRIGSARGRMRAGVGIISNNWGLDYAYVAHDALGAAHQVSMSYSFGTVDTKKALVLDYLALGKAYYNEGKYAEAEVGFKKALEFDPDNAEGRAMLKKSRDALEGKAVGTVEKDIRAEKEAEVNEFLEAGKKFMAEKQWLEAINEFNQALKILPSHPETVKLIREAQAALEAEVSAKVKEEAKEHLGLALKYITTEEYDKALQEVEEVLKIDPGNVEALQLYKKLRKLLQIEEKQ